MPTDWTWTVVWIGIVLAAAAGAVILLRRQAEPALGWALLIAAVSLAIGGFVLRQFRGEPHRLWLIVHLAAGFALGWMVVCAVGERRLRGVIGGQDAIAIVQLFALTSGMVAIVLQLDMVLAEVTYRLGFFDWTIEYLRRVLPPVSYRALRIRPQTIPWFGLLDIAAVAGAAVIGLRLSGKRAICTLLFWLVVLAWLWAALLVKPLAPRGDIRQGDLGFDPTAWPIPAMVGTAITLIAFTLVLHMVELRRRANAWPDRLGDLAAPRSAWPGFGFSAGLAGGGVLVLGCLFVREQWTTLAAALAAAALFLLVYRSWSENLAEAAVALTTLAVVSLSMLGTPPRIRSPNEYPPLLNRALFALAVTVWFWHWLARVWQQQLDGGTAWTTAGRMIPAVRRAAYMIAAIGVLVAFFLAMWPHRDGVTDPDRSLARWVGGPAAIILLTAAIGGAAVRTGKPTLAWLSLLAAGALVAFVLCRSEGLAWRLWIERRGPLALACAGPLVTTIPAMLRLRARNPYVEVLNVCGIMALPALAFLFLFAMPDHRLAGRWITWSTLGVLAAWYGVLCAWAALRELVWVALMLANLAALDVWSQTAMPRESVAIATGVQVTLSGWVLTGVYWRSLGRWVPRCMAALTAVAAGVLVAILMRSAT